MSEGRINKKSYEELINQDVEWLMKNTNHSLEREHIIDILKDSIYYYYQCYPLISKHKYDGRKRPWC